MQDAIGRKTRRFCGFPTRPESGDDDDDACGPPTIAGGEDKTADLDRLAGLMREAKHEDDTYLALMRKAAVHVYRCGRMLHEARLLAKDLKVGWYSLLAEYEIAPTTSSQAIALFEQVRDAGYSEEDIVGKRITEAKVEFGVIKSPKQGEEEAPNKKKPQGKLEDDETPPEGAVDSQANPEKHPDEAGGGADGTEAASQEATATPTSERAPEKPVDPAEDENVWGRVASSDLLVFRRKQLHEDSLRRWNAGRAVPHPEEYLLALLDLGVLWVEDGNVRYLPDHEEDRDELVVILTDKLAPILERWTTADDVMAAIKNLIFAQAGEAEGPEPQASETRPAKRAKKSRPRGRRAVTEPRA